MTVKYLSLMSNGQRSAFHFASHLKLRYVLTVITCTVFTGWLLSSVCSANVHYCVRGRRWIEVLSHINPGKICAEKWTGNSLFFLISLCWWAFEQSTELHFHYHLFLNKHCQNPKIISLCLRYLTEKRTKSSHLWSLKPIMFGIFPW